MNGFCRVCLLRRPQLVSLLADSRSCGTPILDMLASVCGIHFKETPQLSYVICERCLAKLELAHAVAQEFRDQEMLRRNLWQTDAWLVRLEQYQTMVREEPRSERLLRALIASISQENDAETIFRDKEEITSETVVKEELIIEENDEKEPCSTQEFVLDDALEEEVIEDENTHMSQETQPDVELPANRRYRCKECSRTFNSLCVFRNHLRKHQQIRQHLRTKGIEQKRACAHCKREFPDSKSFQCHVSWHKRRGLLCCSTCGENQVTTESLKNHICPLASKPVKSRPTRHQLREESGKRFSTPKYNQIHENIRKGTFKCEICLKSLGGKVGLRNHMREHQTSKKYVKTCEECGKQLTSANAYNCHVYRHRKDQNGSYHCSKCEKNFSTSARLTNHNCNVRDQLQDEESQTSNEVLVKEEMCCEENAIVTVKEETTPENGSELESPAAVSPTTTGNTVLFECEECGKRFSKENLYRNHLQKHENIRSGSFQCDICRQCFGGKRDLRDHKRDNHKPFPKWMQDCEECGRGFANANSYRCHMKRHRVVRSGKYRCAACGKCMTHQKQLTQHKCPAESENK